MRTLYRPSSSQSSIPGKVAAVLSNDNATKKELTVFSKKGCRVLSSLLNRRAVRMIWAFRWRSLPESASGLTTENEVDDDAILAAASQMDKLLAEQSG